jgi:hypothetical protein
MHEMMMLGAGTPVWTPTPSAGSPYQPAAALGTRSMSTPALGTPGIAGPLSTTVYNYGGGMAPTAQQGLVGPGVSVAYPLASSPLAVPIADSTGVVTAASLVAAIAVRRGQLQGPTTDAEVEELMYDALELLPGAADVEVRCENGRVTITGSVQHKRTKRDVGEVAWAIPSVNDVQNNVSIVSRRRARTAGRDADAPASVSARKQG